MVGVFIAVLIFLKEEEVLHLLKVVFLALQTAAGSNEQHTGLDCWANLENLNFSNRLPI